MKTKIIRGYSGNKVDIYNHKFTDSEYKKYSIAKVKTLKRSRQTKPGSNYSYVQGKYKVWLKPRKQKRLYFNIKNKKYELTD